MTSAIRTEALGKRFLRLVALYNLNLDIPTGAVYALVGPNGAGKTTLIKILMNIFEASSGRATVMGTPSTSIAADAFKTIGYVSEIRSYPTGCASTSSCDMSPPSIQSGTGRLSRT